MLPEIINVIKSVRNLYTEEHKPVCDTDRLTVSAKCSVDPIPKVSDHFGFKHKDY